MATMDLSTNQEVMGVQRRYEYAHHVFKQKETFEETDIQGNINLFNTLKTEANSNHDSSSLLQVKCLNENRFEVDNDLFSYSSFKKAMDLRTHNRTVDGVRRTIFDDAEYFAKNYRYKLLPITLEPVDETVIQLEHNYSLLSLNSESEPEENCSRTMDYSQVKEKNYKRRRTKFGEGSDVDEEPVNCCDVAQNGFHSSPTLHEVESLTAEEEQQNASPDLELDNSVQPLDLSAAPQVQEEKTESRERLSSIVENEEVAQLDSDKENVNSELSGILVTITRPDEKEKYQPCDLFLNDIARLVPRLVGKDCPEVDILDMTSDPRDEFPKHRLYYVISESTWKLFRKTDERIILTNDRSLGQPIRKADEEDERPSYLIFDRVSLAKCLAEYCQEIGGCFEYTCVEEEKQETCLKEEEKQETCSKKEEKLETCLKEEEKVETRSNEEEKEETCSKEKEKVETRSNEEEKEETYSKEEEKVETRSNGEEKEETCSKEEEKVETCLKEEEEEEEKMENCSKEEEKQETCSKKEEKLETRSKEEEKRETCSKEGQKAETCTKERGKLETSLREEKKLESCSREMEERVETKKEIQEVDEKEEEEEKIVSEKEPKEEETEKVAQKLNDVTDTVEEPEEELPEVKETKQDSSEVDDVSQKEKEGKEKEKEGGQRKSEEEKAAEAVVPPPEPEVNAPEKADETKQKPPDGEEKKKPKQSRPETVVKTKDNTKKRSRGTKRKRKSSIQRKPKITRTTPRVQSVPESETSQKSDKPVSRKVKREQQNVGKEEPPNKLSKSSAPEEPYRRTRSGKVLEEVKTNKPTQAKKEKSESEKRKEKKKSEGLKIEKKVDSSRQRATKKEEKKTEETGRSLRSHKTTQWKEKVQVWPKTKGRKR